MSAYTPGFRLYQPTSEVERRGGFRQENISPVAKSYLAPDPLWAGSGAAGQSVMATVLQMERTKLSAASLLSLAEVVSCLTALGVVAAAGCWMLDAVSDSDLFCSLISTRRLLALVFVVVQFGLLFAVRQSLVSHECPLGVKGKWKLHRVSSRVVARIERFWLFARESRRQLLCVVGLVVLNVSAVMSLVCCLLVRRPSHLETFSGLCAGLLASLLFVFDDQWRLKWEALTTPYDHLADEVVQLHAGPRLRFVATHAPKAAFACGLSIFGGALLAASQWAGFFRALLDVVYLATSLEYHLLLFDFYSQEVTFHAGRQLLMPLSLILFFTLLEFHSVAIQQTLLAVITPNPRTIHLVNKIRDTATPLPWYIEARIIASVSRAARGAVLLEEPMQWVESTDGLSRPGLAFSNTSLPSFLGSDTDMYSLARRVKHKMGSTWLRKPLISLGSLLVCTLDWLYLDQSPLVWLSMSAVPASWCMWLLSALYGVDCSQVVENTLCPVKTNCESTLRGTSNARMVSRLYALGFVQAPAYYPTCATCPSGSPSLLNPAVWDALAFRPTIYDDFREVCLDTTELVKVLLTLVVGFKGQVAKLRKDHGSHRQRNDALFATLGDSDTQALLRVLVHLDGWGARHMAELQAQLKADPSILQWSPLCLVKILARFDDFAGNLRPHERGALQPRLESHNIRLSVSELDLLATELVELALFPLTARFIVAVQGLTDWLVLMESLDHVRGSRDVEIRGRPNEATMLLSQCYTIFKLAHDESMRDAPDACLCLIGDIQSTCVNSMRTLCHWYNKRLQGEFANVMKLLQDLRTFH
ncbi:MAG: hypothetical protein KVP17_000727 [Porospora cf. gigantea B]|uniref:uncharacterized protein n=2 Tax=Porospora cf. gigantea B TaxID=2853592 RepID=UPI003571C85F|nr:MAG: hypothetical protein KVP17_000727 [Porospora cf. gigantea B]